MKRREELLEALAKLDEAFAELNTLWDEGFELDEMDAIKLYPFGHSFDEVQAEVELWIEAVNEEMKDN